MEPLIFIAANVLLFAAPFLIFGVLIGRTVEKRHFARLDQSDADNHDFLITQIRSFPMASRDGKPPSMVVAEAVIASDYLKTWFAKWRNLFGGEVRSFQTLQIRAKREAIARLTKIARSQGYNALCNVRVDAADVGGSALSRKVPMAAVLASGTAYCTDRS